VVTSANFLIDSESSLKAALSAMAPSAPGPPPHAAPATVPSAPAVSAASPAAPRTLATRPPKPAAYACPMHPEVKSDRPGSCRICGMDLEPPGRR
jgi:hypothetical protein